MLNSKIENLQNYQLKEKAFLLHNSEVYELKPFNVIGSDQSCSVVILADGVESRHFRLTFKNNIFTIKDLNTNQGTYVNETKVIEAELNNGDIITIGSFEFIFSHSPLLPQKNIKLKSKNALWKQQLGKLDSFAKNDYPIILMGESGTGKDVITRLLHEKSDRSHENLVSINCSALSPNLIESELFGHKKGSFTGADRDRNGAFLEANKGTLFLDEIGDLPLDLQPKLLRALENQEIKPVGSDQCTKANVRIIAATHKNLSQLVQKGSFREDLYYRLSVLQLNPPALRERLEDFNDLFYQFAKKYRIRFDYNSIEFMKEYSWPGNIRELKNFVIKASVHFKGEVVTTKKVKQLFKQQGITVGTIIAKPTLRKTSLLKQRELELICEALKANHGNQRKAAHSLGMPTSTMNDRIKKYNIDIQTLKEDILQ